MTLRVNQVSSAAFLVRVKITVMGPKLVVRIYKNPYPLLLVVIALFIAWRNYTTGTFLSGWDTLHPEFNFGTYFRRVIFGVWQEHQGLGAVASQAHASELPRLLLLYPLSFFLPINTLRYVYIFACLVLGPLGVYFFLREVVLRSDRLADKTAAFLGGLFYLTNLATVQHFYVPLEMFTTHYAALGWLFLGASRYLMKPSRSALLRLALVTFLAAPQAHTATLFYAYFLGLLVYVFSWALVSRVYGPRQSGRAAAAVLLMTLLVNSFWLLPNLYFIATRGVEVSQSKIHWLFSQEAFLQNKEFGNFKDTAILKNFLFSWGEHVGGGEYGLLLDEWAAHLLRPGVLIIGYLTFGLVLAGIVLAARRRAANPALPALLALLVLAFFFIINANPPFAGVFDFLRQRVPLFAEALRFPFTKFSLLLVFTEAAFLSIALAWLLAGLARFRRSGTFWVGVLSVVLALGYYFYPASRGGLISPSMRVKIPPRYFELFDYFQSQDRGRRVASFPVHSFWGWVHYGWEEGTQPGFQGAGFLWFGIPQPLLDREFDRWNLKNEQYYREMADAVYAQDGNRLANLLSKYQVDYLILDESVIAPAAEVSELYLEETKALFDQVEGLVLAKDFGEGLLVYRFGESGEPDRGGFLDSLEKYVVAGPEYSVLPIDQAYADHGDYLTEVVGGDWRGYHYPWRDILRRNETVRSVELAAGEGGAVLTLGSAGNLLDEEAGLVVPSIVEKESYLPAVVMVSADPTGTLSLSLQVPVFLVGGEPVGGEVFGWSVPKPVGEWVIAVNDEPVGAGGLTYLNTQADNRVGLYAETTSFSLAQVPVRRVAVLEDCTVGGKGLSRGFSLHEGGSGLTIYAEKGTTCVTVPASEVFTGLGVDSLLAAVSFAEVGEADGPSPQVCWFDSVAERCLTNPEVPLVPSRGRYQLPVSLASHNLEDLSLRLMVNNSGERSEAAVEFSNLVFHLFYLVGEEILTTEDLRQQFPDQVLTPRQLAGGQDSLTFSCPAADTGVYEVVEVKRQPYRCGFREADVYHRAVGEDDRGNYVEYFTQNGSLCDYFGYPDLDHRLGYLLQIEAQNVVGLPLRVCLTNYVSKRCDSYFSLPDDSEFTTRTYLIFPRGDGGAGYDVNLTSISFGDEPSQNRLRSIKIYPLPINWLTSIHFRKESPEAFASGDFRIESAQRHHPALYTAAGYSTGAAALLTLSQAFDPGWAAFDLTTKRFVGDHVLVNNWANGWRLSAGEHRLVIFFWPQLLEFLGFLPIIVIFIGLVTRWGRLRN